MNDIIKGVLIALIPSLIVAYITARLTFIMSVRQLKTQKTWEDKYETYNRIISCLSRLLHCYSELMRVYDPYRPDDFSSENIDRIIEKHRAAIEELHEISGAGVNISSSAADELGKLCEELAGDIEALDPYESACEKHDLIESCLGDIKVYSKEDLAE